MPVYDEAAPRLWPGAAVAAPYTVPLQRLRSHELRLSDGHRVGVTVGGRGIPLVVAHGFSFAGGLYVQSLSRLASMGFRVLAVDLAGHGGGPPPRAPRAGPRAPPPLPRPRRPRRPGGGGGARGRPPRPGPPGRARPP